MCILKYDAFACQQAGGPRCFCLTSIKNWGRKLLLGCICMLFYYLSSGIETCKTESTDNASTLKGWMWRCWVSETAWGSDIWNPELLFCSWSVIPSLPWNSLASTHTYKHHCFQLLRCYGSEKQFFFVLLFQEQPVSFWKLWNICQRVGTVTHRPTPWKDWEGWRHIFQLRKKKVWARIYKLDQCVCIWKQAIFQVPMLIILTVTKVKVLLVKEAKKVNAT